MSSHHPRTCLFSFSTQFENLGDCIINEVLLKEVGRYQPLVILGHRLPEWLTKRLEGVPNVTICRSRPGFVQRLLKMMLSGDRTALLFKPGHMVRRPSLPGQLRMLGVAMITTMLSGLGCRVFRMGTSLDEYGGLENLAQAELGRTHALYGVRDLDSLDAASRLGITAATLTPDLAFLLPYHSGTQTRNELGVSFRRRQWLDQDAGAELLQTILALKAGGRLEPVIVQQVRFDEEVSAKLSGALKGQIVRFEGTDASCREVFERYERCSVVVSNRLHSLLFAWSRGAIPIAIVALGEDSKISGLFAQYSLNDLVIDVRNMQTVRSRLQEILAGAEACRAKLRLIFEQEGCALREMVRNECSESACDENQLSLVGSHS